MERSTILSLLGVAGVISTAIVTAKAATKANIHLEEARLTKGEELTFSEKVKIAGPIYIPSIVIGASTIACVLSSNALNKRTQAALTSAYALLDNSYKEYRKKVNEIYGEDSDSQLLESIAKDHHENMDMPSSDEKVLFFDYQSCGYFEARIEDVLQKVTLDDGLECYILTPPFDNPRNYYIY